MKIHFSYAAYAALSTASLLTFVGLSAAEDAFHLRKASATIAHHSYNNSDESLSGPIAVFMTAIDTPAP